MPKEVKKPVCKLIGENGNVFNLAGKVVQVLRKAGQSDQAKKFQEKFVKCGDYDEALRLMMEYVEVK
jgi:hypothetical protein